MISSLTRRGLVAAAPVAMVAAAMPSSADAFGSRDTELLALRAPFFATMARYKAALVTHSPIEEAFFERVSLAPEADRHLIKEDIGLVAAEKLVNEASADNRKIVEAMCEIPAHTVEGLALKALVSLKYEENLYGELVDSIMSDILAMAGGANA